MALRRMLTKRPFNRNREHSSLVTLELSPIWSPYIPKTVVPSTVANTNFYRQFTKSPDSAENSFLRRFLQRRGINQAARLPEFLSIPVGDKLKETLRSMNVTRDRLRLDGLNPPPPATQPADYPAGISVLEARKILRASQLEKVKTKLRQIPINSISYTEFVQICVDCCSNREQGLEFSKMLDDSGNVIVLGNIVFLRPEQVAKSMEKLVCESIGLPNDPRRKELDQMEKQKAVIDQKAESLVRGELYGGLGFLVLQTLGFMRLTFWELSWDVMEPICFFVTSLHFALAYGFFLRTSREPSFEGYFQRRFRSKQKKLMEIHNFDVKKYDELCQAFYPNYCNPTNLEHFPVSNHAGRVVSDAMY